MSSSTQIGPEGSAAISLREERQELERVAAGLVTFSRQRLLLTYIGDKYFQGRQDDLNEYGIATEVFGRSKSTFNSGEDAIVRVEAHRLRKRLKEYYENEGKDHTIQLSIPPGTYVPVFIRRTPGAVAAPGSITPPRPRIRWWYYAAAAILPIACFGAFWLFHSRNAQRNSSPAISPAAVPATAPNGLAYAQVPLRILAGYSGKPQIDSNGALWQPDQYFRDGGPWTRPAGPISRTSDPMLFEHWRNGHFSYDIPLRPGNYELHLYFVTIDAPSNGGPSFSVSVNGSKILEGFDVYSDALGTNVADERVFRNISPASDGFLHLVFDSERGVASLSALEVLPGLPHQQIPIRLVMQPRSFTDHSGQFWQADDYFMDGYTSAKNAQITGTPDPDIFAAERYGHFTYAIPVDTRDRYTLILHFAEFYFGANAPGGAGSRVFRVLCNGNTLLDNFDIYKEAGSLHALTKTFSHLKPSAQGKLNLTFEPVANYATVSGIEVVDESQ